MLRKRYLKESHRGFDETPTKVSRRSGTEEHVRPGEAAPVEMIGGPRRHHRRNTRSKRLRKTSGDFSERLGPKRIAGLASGRRSSNNSRSSATRPQLSCTSSDIRPLRPVNADAEWLAPSQRDTRSADQDAPRAPAERSARCPPRRVPLFRERRRRGGKAEGWNEGINELGHRLRTIHNDLEADMTARETKPNTAN